MCNSYCQICCNKQLILLKIIITIIAKIGYGVGIFWGLAVKGLIRGYKETNPREIRQKPWHYFLWINE